MKKIFIVFILILSLTKVYGEDNKDNIVTKIITHTEEKIVYYHNNTFNNIIKYGKSIKENFLEIKDFFSTEDDLADINNDPNYKNIKKEYNKEIEFINYLKENEIKPKIKNPDIFLQKYDKIIDDIRFEKNNILNKNIKIPFEINGISKNKEVIFSIDLQEKLFLIKDLKGKVLYNSLMYGIDYRYKYPYDIDIIFKNDNSINLFIKILIKDGVFIKKDLLVIDIFIEEIIKDEVLSFINKNNNEIDFLTNDKINKKYNILEKDVNILTGDTKRSKNSKGYVSNIYINDYKLNSFNPLYKDYMYRLQESLDTIVEGRNEYKIYFEIDGEKILQDTIYVYLRGDYYENIGFIYEDLKGEKIDKYTNLTIDSIYKIDNKDISTHCNLDYFYIDNNSFYCSSKRDNTFISMELK